MNKIDNYMLQCVKVKNGLRALKLEINIQPIELIYKQLYSGVWKNIDFKKGNELITEISKHLTDFSKKTAKIEVILDEEDLAETEDVGITDYIIQKKTEKLENEKKETQKQVSKVEKDLKNLSTNNKYIENKIQCYEVIFSQIQNIIEPDTIKTFLSLKKGSFNYLKRDLYNWYDNFRNSLEFKDGTIVNLSIFKSLESLLNIHSAVLERKILIDKVRDIQKKVDFTRDNIHISLVGNNVYKKRIGTPRRNTIRRK
jgi:prophage DNA circulation protein